MALNIEQFRQQYPEYNDLNDSELVDTFYKKFYSDIPREEFNAKIGYSGIDSSPDGVTFFEALQAGTESLWNSGKALEAGIYDYAGYPEAAEAATQEYRKNQQNIAKLLDGATDWRDIANAETLTDGATRTFDYVMENFGLNSPQMAAIIAGGLGTAAITPYTPEPISLAISKIGGFSLGATAVALPMFTGFNLGRQIDEGEEMNLPSAMFWSVPESLAETFMAGTLTKTGLTKAGEMVLGKFSNNTAVNVSKKLAELIAIGVPAEVIQQSMERAAANLEVNPMTSEDAFNEYVDTAFQAAAAMTPMGSIALLNKRGANEGVSKRDPTEVKEMLSEEDQGLIKKDIETSSEPKGAIVKTPQEASSLLTSVGIDPTIFDPKALVRAANVIVERSDQNRAKFLEAYNTSKMPLNVPGNPTGNIAALKQAKDAKLPFSADILTQLKTDQEYKELSSLISVPEVTTPLINLDTAPQAFTQSVELGNRLREQRLTPSKKPTQTSRDPIVGAISENLGNMLKGFEKDLNIPALELRELAVNKFKIPEAELKDRAGKPLPVADVRGKIMEKVLENVKPRYRAETQPTPEVFANKANEPLNRITPSDMKTLENTIQEVNKSARVLSQNIEPAVKTYETAVKTAKSQTRIREHLSIDPNTGMFKSALKATQAVNKLFTSVNFKNITDFPNMDIHLQEAWSYHFSNLPKTSKDTLNKALPKSLETFDDITKPNMELWAKTEQGKEEIYSNLFAEYAQNVREGKKQSKTLPKDVQAEFDNLVKILDKASTDMSKGGLKTFSDIFEATIDAEQTPRESLIDSVEKLRKERLKDFSDALQFQNWKALSDFDYKGWMDDNIKEGKRLATVKKVSTYQRFVASAVHMASKNPIFSVAYSIRTQQEALQSQYLTAFTESMEKWVREPNQEVRVKAVEILDYLRNTDQKLTYDSDGAIVFTRDGHQVKIKHPTMVELISSVDSAMKQILNAQEGEMRNLINQYVPDGLIKSLKEIKADIDALEETLDPSDFQHVSNLYEGLVNLQRLKALPYVPRKRFGSFGFVVQLKSNLDKNGNVKPGAKQVYFAAVEEGKHKGRWDKLQYDEVQKDLAQYRGKPEYVIFEDTLDSPFELEHNNIFNKISQDAITFEMISGLIGADKTQEYAKALTKSLDSKAQFRGFKKHFAEAKNIPGYSKDWDRVMSGYVTHAAHFMAKSRYAPLMEMYGNKVDTLSNNHKVIKDKTKSYIEYTNSFDDSWQNIRKLNYYWTMGGNPSTAGLQIVTLPTTSMSSMTQYNLNPVKNAYLLSKNFKIGMATIMNHKTSVIENGSMVFKIDSPEAIKALKKQKVSDDTIAFLKKAFHRGTTGALLLEEQVGRKRYETRSRSGQLKTATDSILNATAIPMSLMEQVTRFATVAAHYEMFKNNPDAVGRGLKLLKDDYRFQALRKTSGNTLIEDLAFFGLDESHAVFGKVGRSDLLRGGLGAFVFPFQTYTMQAVEFMSRMYGRGPAGKAALALMTASIVFFAGGMGLPGAELLKELLEEVYKGVEGEEVDIEFLIRDKLTQATGDPRYGKFLTQGVFRSNANLDLSKRAGTPVFGQDVALAFAGVRGDMTNLAGVQGSMITNALEAFHAYNRDEGGAKIASLLTPTAVSNIFKAYTYYDEGVKTRKGTQLLTPEQVKDNPIEVLERLLGFGTDTVASAREATYWGQIEDVKYKPAMDTFRAKAKNYVTQLVRASKQGDQKKAQIFREKFQGVIKDLGEFSKRKKMPLDYKSFINSVIDGVDQRLVGGLRYEDLNKNVRHRKKDIEKAAGVK